jgi:hypothetical protein
MIRTRSPSTSVRQARAALRSHFQSAGFAQAGSCFVHETAELRHSVELTAVRRISGFVQLMHQVSAKGQTQVLLSEEIASHGHGSPFPRIWSASSIDPCLLLDQVSAIVQAFQTLSDLAHFYSDRPNARPDASFDHTGSRNSAHSLCEEDTARILTRLGREIFGESFSLVTKGLEFELWVDKQEVGGFRHCVYLEPNFSCTLGIVVHLSLPAKLIARGFSHEDALRKLIAASKHILFDAGRPVLLPLLQASPSNIAAIHNALLVYLREHPPNLLPREIN